MSTLKLSCCKLLRLAGLCCAEPVSVLLAAGWLLRLVVLAGYMPPASHTSSIHHGAALQDSDSMHARPGFAATASAGTANRAIKKAGGAKAPAAAMGPLGRGGMSLEEESEKEIVRRKNHPGQLRAFPFSTCWCCGWRVWCVVGCAGCVRAVFALRVVMVVVFVLVLGLAACASVRVLLLG